MERLSHTTKIAGSSVWTIQPDKRKETIGRATVERAQARQLVRFGSDAQGPWRGFQVDRAAFDRILRDEALALGAVVLQPCRVKNIRRQRSEVLVECDDGRLRARVVVDATGSARLIARRLDLEILRRSPRIIARYGYREGEAAHLYERPVFIADRWGWQWMAQVRPGVCQWVTVCWEPFQRTVTVLPPVLGSLPEIGPCRGADVSWRILREPAGRGYFAVGDAAAFIDPSCSQGVLQALASGLMAACCIRKRLVEGGNETAAVGLYNEWIHRTFRSNSSRLMEFYPPIAASKGRV